MPLVFQHLKNSLRDNWRSGLAGAVGSILLGLCFLFFPPIGEGLTNLSYDLPFFFRDDIAVPEVAIIYMDHDSHLRLDQKIIQRFDRRLHAKLLQKLKEARPRAIVFDVFFSASDNDPAGDAEFVAAVKSCGSVAVGAMEVTETIENRPIGTQVQDPFAALAAVAKVGVVEAGPSTFREHFRGFGDTPSLAWQVAAMTTARPPDRQTPRWINYYGPPGHLPHFSYAQVYYGLDDITNFTGKVVFIGALYSAGFAGGKGTDDYPTPYTHWTGTKSAGVEINATTYLNLARGDWLRRLPPWSEFFLLLGLGGLFGFGLGCLRPLPALGVGFLAALLVAFVAVTLVWQQHLWFSWVIVCAVQIPAAVAWTSLAYSQRLLRERDFLQRQIKAARVPVAAVPGASSVAAAVAAAVPKAAAGLSSFFNSPGVAIGQRALPPMALAEATPAIPDHTLIRRIGRGSYGEVWLAQDVISTFHAVKIIYRASFDHAAPFEREFHGLKKFTPVSRSHPGFVHVLHVGRNEPGEYFYYVMELADDEHGGQTIDPASYSPRNLAKDLKRRTRLPLEECLQLAMDLTAALAHLHQHQLIHRDIKPANIIFVNGVPKFADIGLVTDLAGTGRDVTCLGTQGYIAPEGPGTAAADVYSLGKVIYEAAFGLDRDRFPELPTALMTEPAADELFELNRIILRACENEVRKRYSSSTQMHAELDQLLRTLRRAAR